MATNALATNPVNALVQGIYDKAKEAGDYVAQRYQALKTDPLGDMQKTMQGTMARNAARDALNKKAFGNPKNPLEITDPEAYNELMDQALNAVTSFAPVGMLRLGGRKDLIASHGSKAVELLDENGKLVPELTNMSAAIQKDRLDNPWGEGTGGVKLIVRPNVLDPKTASSIIHTHDAFTPPSWMSEVSMLGENGAVPTANALVNARMNDRFLRQYPRGGAGAEAEGAGALGSRMFNSYKGFENSPQGATVLGVHIPAQGPLAEFRTLLEKIADEQGGNAATALRGIMEAPGQWYKGFDKYKMYKQIMSEPRAYAELKSFGQTPLNSDTFAGAIVQPSSGSITQRSAQYELMKQLEARGIPVHETTSLPVSDFQLATQLQQMGR